MFNGGRPHCHTASSYGIRVKVMSIQSCQVAPSSERSHLAVMLPLAGLTLSVDRTAPLASAGWSRYSGDVAATDEGPHTVLVNPGMQDRDFTLVVIGAACELISSRVVFDATPIPTHVDPST